MIRLVALSLLLVGCPSESQHEDQIQYQVTKTPLGSGTYRIENEEVICYYKGGIDCKFKGEVQ